MAKSSTPRGARLTVNLGLVEDLQEYTREFRREAEKTVEPVLEDARDTVLVALRYYPPEPSPSRKIRWKSAKQEQAFQPNGGPTRYPYKRTYRLRRGWKARVTKGRGRNAGNVGVEVSTDVPYARFVQGDLRFDGRAKALLPQQPFHQDTGWPLAMDAINATFDAAKRDMAERLTEKFGDDIARIAARRRKL